MSVLQDIGGFKSNQSWLMDISLHPLRPCYSICIVSLYQPPPHPTPKPSAPARRPENPFKFPPWFKRSAYGSGKFGWWYCQSGMQLNPFFYGRREGDGGWSAKFHFWIGYYGWPAQDLILFEEKEGRAKNEWWAINLLFSFDFLGTLCVFFLCVCVCVHRWRNTINTHTHGNNKWYILAINGKNYKTSF